MKLTYLILTFPFSTNCGGIVVLHKLCHLMRKLGHDAYLWFPEGRSHVRNPDYDTPIGNPNGAGREGAIDPRDCCVIYPEIVHGNPLEAKVPVTWLLYHTGDNDTNRIKVAYDPLYAANHRDAERLTVVETFPEHCRLPTPDELSANPREGACFVVRKGTGTPRIPETENGRAVEITNTTVENATAVFRRSEVFYNYDAHSFHSIQAALCGCESVIVPQPGLSKIDFRAGHPLCQFRVAYGLDERHFAKNPMPVMREWMDSVERESEQQIGRLVERVERAARVAT
jgi:hypothetical protein